MVPLNSLNDRPVRLPPHIDMGEIVPLSNVFVVVYDCVADNRYHTIPFNDGVIICVPDPDISVVVDIVQVVPVDYYGSLEVSISVSIKIYIRYVDILDNDCARSPTSVTIIGFTGS